MIGTVNSNVHATPRQKEQHQHTDAVPTNFSATHPSGLLSPHRTSFVLLILSVIILSPLED